MSEAMAAIVRVGIDLTIDLDARIVCVNERPISLAHNEWRVADLLARNKGDVVSVEMILQHLYGETNQPQREVASLLIRGIRHKIMPTHPNRYIRTIPRKGYILADPD